MASSSNPSSAPTRRARYDVFLSFRGEDTRLKFVDHLFDTMDRSGMEVFKDNLNLARGKEISPQLLKAIKQSRCAVVVFSKNYAESSWCLVELAKIMECHNREEMYVLPVFYHVDPSDVRRQKAKFDTAFQQHEVRFRDEVQGWREALSAAGKLSGHHISKGEKKGEVQFIKEILDDVLKKIPRDSLEKDKIGINFDINKLVSILDIESTQEVRTLGIWGMGGIGKTTIARALFNRVRHKFEGSSFVSDVRTKSKGDICSLQKQILTDMGIPKTVEFPDKEAGAELIQKRLCMMKVLLVLDDVDNADQLEFLAVEKEWFGVGSRIILTTRDEQVLTLANTNDRFKHAPLSTNEALNLFCIHAFQQSSPPNEYVVLSDNAINYCGGLPLALKVLGCHFRGRNAAEWKSSLSRLGNARDMEMRIYETLRISFDGLKDSEKEIFLDIVCFFKGLREQRVIRVLDGLYISSGRIGVRVLIQKSLITLSNKQIKMHDLIQEMGEQIALDTDRKRRLSYRRHEEIRNLVGGEKTEREKIEAIVDLQCVHEDDLYYQSENQDKPNQILSNEAESDEIPSDDQDESFFDDLSSEYDGILSDDQDEPDEIQSNEAESDGILSDDQDEPDEIQSNEAEFDEEWWNSKHCFNGDVFENMKELRLLCVQGKFTSREPTFLPDKLRWLGWNHYPFPSLPLANLSQLAGLEIYKGKLKRLWEGKKDMPYLKVVDLSYLSSLKRLPDISNAPNVEWLRVEGCCNLVEIHNSLASHKKLVYLDIRDCIKLEHLPSLKMESLETLILSSCTSLKRFPQVSSCMVKLSMINLLCCLSLAHIPKSICKLKNLKSLNLSLCTDLQKLPRRLGSMRNLENLHVGVLFPARIDSPTWTTVCGLKNLSLKGRQIKDKDLLNNLTTLSSLESLNLGGNMELIQLSDSISHLRNLKRLELSKCDNLRSIGALPSGIEVLDAPYCNAVEHIEDLTQGYERLYKIDIADCKKLLQDQEMKGRVEKILQESFFMRHAIKDRGFRIVLPGRKIPSWFREQQEVKDMTPNTPSFSAQHVDPPLGGFC